MPEIPEIPETPQPRSALRNLPRNVWILTIVSFLTDISSDMIVNLVPLFLTQDLGVGKAIVGLIEGIAETTASLMKVYSGGLSDKLGRRKWLAVFGYGLSAISKPFLYFANGWLGVLAVRFTDRLGKGIRTAPKEALLARSVDKDHRGLAFGVQRAGDTGGAFIGMLIATLIIWLTQTNPNVLSTHTFQIVIIASIIPGLLAVVVLAFGAKEVTIEGDKKAPVLSLKGLDKRFIAFLLVTILFTLGNSSDAFITLLAKDRGLSIIGIMAMLLTFNAVYTILAGPAGALSDKIGRRKLIIVGWIAYGLIYLGFALSKSATAIWVLYGFYGVYYALTEGAGKALIADLVPDEKRGTAYGLYAAAIGITAFPASAIAGVLWSGIGKWAGFGPSAPFFFGAGLTILAGILFWRLVK